MLQTIGKSILLNRKVWKHILLYALGLAALAFLLKWLEWSYVIRSHSWDIYIGIIAILFTGLGIWIANQLLKPKVKTIIMEREVVVHPPQQIEVDVAFVQK